MSPLARLVRALEAEEHQVSAVIDMVAAAGGTTSQEVHFRRGLRMALVAARVALDEERSKPKQPTHERQP